MHRFLKYLLVTALLSPVLGFASEGGHEEHKEHAHGEHKAEHKPWSELTKDERKAAIKEDIQHHLLDSYDFHIFSDKSDPNDVKHYGFPLPVILWDGGLHVFMSSKFDHGHAVAESNGNYYTVHHNKIYKTDEHGTIEFDEEGHAKNAAPIDLSITKNVFMSLIVAALIFFIFRGVAKAYRNSLSPTGSAKFFEPIILFVRDEIAIPNIGEKHHRRYMGYLLTVFFFIWFLNLFGMTPLGINVTGNIAVTACLALMTFFITTFTANKHYWGHIFWMPGVPVPMKFVLAPIELLGIFIKPFALMIRLYANMMAGHVVIGSLIGLIFVFGTVFSGIAFFGLSFILSIIELLVAFLQAYIFTMLTALYFGGAVADHEHH